MKWFVKSTIREARYTVKKLGAFCLISCLVSVLFFSCKKDPTNQVVIWTDQQLFVSYAELFNASQDEVKAVVLYKERPVDALPPAKDEQVPDIIVGSWLRNENSIHYFRPLDSLFGDELIDSSIFYPQLFQYGNQDDNQYFLPVSFNLPAVIFSKKNEDIIPEDFILTTDQIRDTAALFNKQNDSGIYTSMGFAPSWDPEFLYLIARLKETNFRPFNNNFLWNSEKLEDTVSYIKYWTETYNTSVQAEQDYEFKYLYTPPIKQIIADSCLFAYTTSAQIFSASEEDLQQIDFRWIHKDNNLPVEEDMLLLGIYKKASNFLGAETFISWLMKEETQQEIMTRMDSMNLNISHFGIAGGFSAIRSVNEIIFPQHYKILLGNIPAAEYIQPPTPLPSQWKNIKNQIINPWIQDAVAGKTENSIEVLFDEWAKRIH